MNELDEFFKEIMEEKRDQISSILKEMVLKEICYICYEIMLKTAMEDEEIDQDELYHKVIEMMDDNES